MEKQIPQFLKDLLIEQYGEEISAKIENGYKAQRPVTLRVNNLKTSLEKAKEKLKGEEVTSSNELDEKMGITESQFQEDKSNLIFYYKLSTQDLENMGISKVESDSKNGFYIIKYDVKNAQIDIYNEKGFENQDKTYYTLNEIENLKI